MNERLPRNKKFDPSEIYPDPVGMEFVESMPEIEIEKEVREAPSEGTPFEWREKLRGLIFGAKERLGMSERGEQLKLNLVNRSRELDTEAEKLGWVEKSFRSFGEKYNKLNWKSKLAVGAALGLGAAAFSTVSVPAAFACMSGIAVQRIAGMSSMFLKFEKKDQPGQRKKEIAMLMAAGYSLGMGAAISEAVHLASESSYGEAVHEWLKHNWPFGHAAAVAPKIATPEMPHPAAAAAAGESFVPPVHAPEMPAVSVDAAPGHGYEYMAKRLWEQLRSQNLDASKFDANSDIHKLLTADSHSIDGVVHQIASDPQHGFFNADGTSVQINLSEHMTISADGQIHLGDAVHAPAGATVTPPYHFETPPASPVETPVASAVEPSAPPDEVPIPPAVEANVPPPEPPPHLESPPAHVEAPPPPPPMHFELPHGLENTPGVYADPSGHLIAYGGSPEQQFMQMQQYFAANPNVIIYRLNAFGYPYPYYYYPGMFGGRIIYGIPISPRSFFGPFATVQRLTGLPGPFGRGGPLGGLPRLPGILDPRNVLGKNLGLPGIYYTP